MQVSHCLHLRMLILFSFKEFQHLIFNYSDIVKKACYMLNVTNMRKYFELKKNDDRKLIVDIFAIIHVKRLVSPDGILISNNLVMRCIYKRLKKVNKASTFSSIFWKKLEIFIFCHEFYIVLRFRIKTKRTRIVS